MYHLRRFLDYLYTRNAYSFLIQGSVCLRNASLREFVQFGDNHKMTFSVRLQNPQTLQQFITQWVNQTNAEINTIYWEHPMTHTKITIHYSLRALEITTSSRRILEASANFANIAQFNLKQDFIEL